MKSLESVDCSRVERVHRLRAFGTAEPFKVLTPWPLTFRQERNADPNQDGRSNPFLESEAPGVQPPHQEERPENDEKNTCGASYRESLGAT